MVKQNIGFRSLLVFWRDVSNRTAVVGTALRVLTVQRYFDLRSSFRLGHFQIGDQEFHGVHIKVIGSVPL